MNVTREGDLLGLPSHFVGSEGSMISEVREEGEGGALDGSGVGVSLQSEIVSHFVVLLRSGVVWYGYNIPQSLEFVNG